MITGLTLKGLIETGSRPRPFILKPWIKAGDLGMIYAERGLGKTWFSLFLANALATGGTLGNWECKPKKVLYVDGEMGNVGIANRFGGILRGEPSENLTFLTSDMTGGQMWNLASDEGKKRYWPLFEPADVIILDNLMTVTERIDAFDSPLKIWERVQKSMIRLRSMMKTVILIHHTNKGGEQQSGSKDKENIMNFIIGLHHTRTEPGHNGCKFTLDFEKLRDTKSIDKTIWTLHQDGYGKYDWKIKSEAQSICGAIKHFREEGWKENDIAKYLMISKTKIKFYMDRDISDLPSDPLSREPVQPTLFNEDDY